MGIIDIQITLMQERLTELRQQRREQRQRYRAAHPINGPRYGELRFSRAKRACALRWQGLKYKEVAAALNVGVGRAQELARRGLRYFTSRRLVPAIHELEGESWLATNCDYTWQHSLDHRQCFTENDDPILQGF